MRRAKTKQNCSYFGRKSCCRKVLLSGKFVVFQAFKMWTWILLEHIHLHPPPSYTSSWVTSISTTNRTLIHTKHSKRECLIFQPLCIFVREAAGKICGCVGPSLRVSAGHWVLLLLLHTIKRKGESGIQAFWSTKHLSETDFYETGRSLLQLSVRAQSWGFSTAET